MRQLLEFEKFLLRTTMWQNGLIWTLSKLQVVNEWHDPFSKKTRDYVNRGFTVDFVESIPDTPRFYTLPIREDILGDYFVTVVDPNTLQPVRLEALNDGIPQTALSEEANCVESTLAGLGLSTSRGFRHQRFANANGSLGFFYSDAPRANIPLLASQEPVIVVGQRGISVEVRRDGDGRELIDGLIWLEEE